MKLNDVKFKIVSCKEKIPSQGYSFEPYLKKFHDSSNNSIVTVIDGDGDDSVDVPFLPDLFKGSKLPEPQCQNN